MKDSINNFNSQFEQYTGLKRIFVHVKFDNGDTDVKAFPSYKTTKCTVHYLKAGDIVIVELHDSIFSDYGNQTRGIVITEFTKQFHKVYGTFRFLIFKEASVIFESSLRRHDNELNRYDPNQTGTIH